MRRPVTRGQALAVFSMTVVVGLTLSIRGEIQDRRIDHNTQQIILANWQGCVNGVKVLGRLNAQMEELAKIEGTQTVDRKLALRRIAAYRSGLTTPIPDCGPEPVFK